MLAKLQRQEGDIASGRADGPEALMETARTCMDFSYYQLAQDARREECLARAEELLEKVTAGPDPDPEAWILLGRAALFRYDGRRAMECFNAFLRHNPDSGRGMLWRAEAAYLMGDFARVRADCAAALTRGDVSDAMLSSARFWVGEEAEAVPAGGVS